MYNPLQWLTEGVLNELIIQGHLYFIRQNYPRGLEQGIKASVLITPYRTKQEADAHYAAIRFDSRKYLYNIDHALGDPLSRDYDLSKLHVAAGQPAGYRIYIDRMLHRDTEWFPPRPLLIQIHELAKRIGLAGRNMYSDVKLTLKHGELKVVFTHKGKSEIISLDDLEKL